MRRALLLFTALTMPVSAQALSCRRPEPADAFNAAADSEARYRILVGTLAFDASLLPPTIHGVANDEPRPPVVARFKGQALGLDGLTETDVATLTILPDCAGMWCGTLHPDRPYLIFAREGAEGLEVDLGPCPEWTFANPQPEVIRNLTLCLMKGRCEG